MENKILITGCAGFIGYHLTKSLLNDGYLVLGIDNINDYYSIELKKDRLKQFKNYSNFLFDEIDIAEKKSISKAFESFKPSKVVNLAAQAGVRYSIKNPYTYMSSNLVGFLNILELCRHTNVEGLIYASSSSVYGSNKDIPFSENHRVNNPISFYGASKRSNELMAMSYSSLYDLRTTGLRFFTVYGPWGRPDMAMLLFIRNIIFNKPIKVFNNGNMKRDFTYINDIIAGIRSAMDKNYKCEIFNLGNNKSEKLMDMIAIIENELNRKAKIEFQSMQLGDVQESFASIDKSSSMLDFNPSVDIQAGIPNLIKWFKDYYEILD